MNLTVRQNRLQGVSLVELIVVVSTFGVLLSIAIPQYQNYRIRERVTASLALAAPAQTAVSQKLAAATTRPVTAYAGVGPSGPDSYAFRFTPTPEVASIAIAGTSIPPAPGDGRIAMTFAAGFAAPGMVLRLTPVSGGPGTPLTWTCDVNGVSAFYKYAPVDCRS